jgi:SAM-dependent methyltransferase
MSGAQRTHHDGGLHRVLNRAGIYSALQNLLLREGNRDRYVREFVRPFAGCRVLDIGCGPGDILGHLPESIGGYIGFDMNPEYIEAARKRWGARGAFRCEKVEAATVRESGAYDIVLATAILHHLGDVEALGLFDIAHRVLRPGGRLVTYDPVRIENQHWFARWMIDHDRGKAVRTRDGYEVLARSRFHEVESALLHDTLRVPYTILIMSCTKAGDPSPKP